MEEIYQQSRIHVYVKKSEPAKQQDGTGVWRLMICDDDLVTDSNKKTRIGILALFWSPIP